MVASDVVGRSAGSVGVLARRRFQNFEQMLRERIDALGTGPRAELLHVLTLPDFDAPTGSESSGATPRLAPSPSY
jgi:hypothetical protein